MLKTAPNPVDVQDLQFKLHCRLKVCSNKENGAFSRYCSLVACASRFGLIFVGNTSDLQAIQLKEIEKLTKSDGDKADYPRRNLLLPSPPSHLSVNCEHTVLAIVTEKNECPCALFYDVKSFWQKDIVQIGEVRLSSTPGVHVTETNWNPALGSIFTACKSDGTLGIYEIKNSGVDINELPAAAGATCFCWSPKGKQIAIGSRDGKITQLKPDLKAVKVISSPPLKEPHTLVSLQWVSNYQFIGVYQSGSPDGQAVFIVIDAPKSGDPTYINYDDICYSNGATRPVQFYMILLQGWNIVMAASSNSMEVGILGNAGECWSQWIMGDAARAELPLSTNHQETLPVGCALDIGSTQPIPWGESTLPPTPLLLLLSHHGILCCFNVINLKEGIPSLCTPPDAINDMSGLQFYLAGKSEQNTNILVKESSKIIQQPTIQSSNVESLKTSSPQVNTSIVLKVEPQPTNMTQGVNPSINLSQNKPVNLFGGQATLTPITQGNKNNSATSISQYQSILPSSSNISRNMTDPSPQMLPSTVAPSPIVSKELATVAPTLTSNNTLKLSQPECNEDFNRTEVISVDLKADEQETENIFGQMVREECIFLESEVKAVIHQGKNLKYNLGSDTDKIKIVENTKSLEDFFHEVVEICTTQSAEVHILKQNLLQSWAWYEEAKSRHLASEDESMMILIRAQPLDSASEKQLADIQHTNYYLESQISQAHMVLDEQWENFQDYCKKTYKLQIPTMEMIFQTMVKQNAILRKQSYVLKDIASRIKHKSRSALGPSLLITIDNVKDLPEELRRLRMNPEDIYQIRHEHVVKRMKHFTMKKANTIRYFLQKREYPHISAVKPQLSSSVIQISPSSQLKQNSLLTSKTPTGHIFSKKLNFVQSTPTPSANKDVPLTPEVQSSTPLEGLQNFALQFEARNFPNLPEKTFTPLTKNLIASSPHSAFVSTSLGSNYSTSIVTPSSSKPIFLGLSSVAATPSVAKTVPSYVVVTTTSQTNQPIVTIAANVSKPFSFINSSASQENMTNVSKSGVNLFSSSGTKPVTPFNVETDTSRNSFGMTYFKSTPSPKPTMSVFNITTSKPNSSTVASFNVTQPVKFTTPTIDSSLSVTSTKMPATSSFLVGSPANSVVPTSPSFSFGTSSAPIFTATTQKSSESTLPIATNKPFVFSSKTMPPTSSIIHNLLTLQNTSAANTQPINLSSTTTSLKVTSSLPSSVTSTFKNTAVSSSDIFTSTPVVSTAKISPTTLPGNSAQSAIFNTAAAATSTQPTIFSLAGAKPPLFITTLSTASTASAVITTSVAAAGPVTAPKTIGTSSPLASTSESGQSTSAKQNVFKSTVSGSSSNTNTSTFSPASSATGFTFASTPSSKPVIFSTAEATNSKPSLFGSSSKSTINIGTSVTPTPTSQSSIFAVAPSTTITNLGTSSTQSSIFGGIPSGSTTVAATQSSIFGGSVATPSTFGVSSASTTKSSIFGSASGTSTSTTGLGSLTTTTQSIFGSAPSTTSSFVVSTTSTTTSIFAAAPTTSAASFGTPTTSTTQPSVFGSTASTSTVFGISSTSTKQPSIFGTPSTTTTLFGTPTTTASQSIFGSASANQSSVFGTAVSSAAPQSIFGSSTPTTSQSTQGFGIFGDGAQKSSIFGSPSTTQSSIFGSNQSTVFGNTNTQNTSSSVFSQSQSSNTFGQPSVFGSAPAFASTSVFGNSAPSFGQSAGSVFGNAPSTTSSIFGGTASTGNTVFGTPASSASAPFGSGSVFASPTTQPSSFSANSGAASFGFGNLSVGSAAKTSSPGFGSGSTTNPFGSDNKTVFGSATTPSGTPAFGSSSASVFGSPSQNFGGAFSNQAPFGQQSNFGQSQSLFGNSSFDQTPGPFSGGSAGGVGQAGFGTGANFQKPGGFGSSPVFGGSPSFGSAPSFGGVPAFGSPPAFGSGSKVFGSSSPGFVPAVDPQGTGFSNLANQQTVGFGNLAQQAANAPNSSTSFSGNSSFTSWR